MRMRTIKTLTFVSSSVSSRVSNGVSSRVSVLIMSRKWKILTLEERVAVLKKVDQHMSCRFIAIEVGIIIYEATPPEERPLLLKDQYWSEP